MDKHLQSALHIAACREDRLKVLSQPYSLEDDATIDSQISKANNALFRRIDGYMFTVLNDAKRGTLKAWSWPSRAFQRKEHFMANGMIKGFEENPNDFRYVFPGSHSGMLGFIVNADMKQMSDALNDCLAISLIIDGSVNRMQIHNNHLQAKVIYQDGSSSFYFLVFDESEDRGAKGYLVK